MKNFKLRGTIVMRILKLLPKQVIESMEADVIEHYKFNIDNILREFESELTALESVRESKGKTAEEILFDTMTENNFTYVSFPAFVENESSVDVFDIACKAIEKYASQFTIEQKELSDEEMKTISKEYSAKNCYGDYALIYTAHLKGMKAYRDQLKK